MSGIRNVDLLQVVGDAIEAGGGASREEYDVEAIAAACYRHDERDGTYHEATTPEEFWETVEANALWLTVDQAAARWGVKPPTFRAYVARDQAPQPGRKYGRTPLWSRGALDEALKARRGQAWRSTVSEV